MWQPETHPLVGIYELQEVTNCHVVCVPYPCITIAIRSIPIVITAVETAVAFRCNIDGSSSMTYFAKYKDILPSGIFAIYVYVVLI
jgi:hypothetical protein